MILWELANSSFLSDSSFIFNLSFSNTVHLHLFIKNSNVNVTKLNVIPKNRAIKMPVMSCIVMELVECFFSFFSRVHLSSGHSRFFHFCSNPVCPISVILEGVDDIGLDLYFYSDSNLLH